MKLDLTHSAAHFTGTKVARVCLHTLSWRHSILCWKLGLCWVLYRW